MSLSDIKEIQALNAKLEWAERHIDKLQSYWDAFKDGSYSVAHNDDPETGEREYYLADARDIENDLPLRIGDIVHNLRCSLDHVIYRLAQRGSGGQSGFETNLHFPVGKDLGSFEESLARASKFKIASNGSPVQRLRNEAIRAIRDFQPYNGGPGRYLWVLHRLDIIDKHHLLLAAAAMNRQHTMPQQEIQDIKAKFLGTTAEYPPEFVARAFLKNSDIIAPFPLKAGDILARVPKAEINDEIYFHIELAFAEPEIVKGQSVLAALWLMAGTVGQLIRTLDNKDLFD